MSATTLNIEAYIQEMVDKAVEEAIKKIAQPKFYTPDVIAKKLDMNRDSVYRLTREGKLGCYKIGSKVLVSDEQLTNFLTSKRQYTKYERTVIADTHVATH